MISTNRKEIGVFCLNVNYKGVRYENKIPNRKVDCKRMGR